MKPSNYLTLSTSPLSQPAKKPRKTASLARRQRPLYGRKHRYSTGKERDTETGLYYYGARYLDGRTGRWLSGDPAVGEYVPEAPVDDGARKRNGSLPGQGGVFNYVNLHVYHYAGNNPVKLVDPDGRIIRVIGDDGVTYTWDDEKNQFYSGRGDNRNYEINDGFVKDVQDSLVYLKEGSDLASYDISKVSSSNRLATIRRGRNKRGRIMNAEQEGFLKQNIRIYFSPRTSIIIDDGTGSFMSPALGLFHELSHAYSHLVENKLVARQKDTSVDPRNKNAEEVNAMQRSNVVAAYLGEPIRAGYYSHARFGPADSVRHFRNNQK